VFGIVQQSLGSIWVYSEPGNGTTFKVYLPRVDADAEAEQHQSLAASGGPRGTETILVVEDDPQVRAVILTVLQRHGYRVLAADGGAEALALCEEHAGKIDLVLTDVVMPRMSGPVLAKSLSSKWPELKVLFMSGYTDDGVFRHGVLETGLAFLQKPIMPATLTRKVRDVLDARGGRSLTEA
jgi:CheY-like chemotaxis protein